MSTTKYACRCLFRKWVNKVGGRGPFGSSIVNLMKTFFVAWCTWSVVGNFTYDEICCVFPYMPKKAAKDKWSWSERLCMLTLFSSPSSHYFYFVHQLVLSHHHLLDYQLTLCCHSPFLPPSLALMLSSRVSCAYWWQFSMFVRGNIALAWHTAVICMLLQ